MATFTRTVRDLITDALIDVEAVGAGETPESEDIALGLSRLNNMVDGLAARRLAIYRVQRKTFMLTAADADYTIGSGGAIDVAWPEFIVRAGYVQVGSTTELPVDVLTEDEWSRIDNKGFSSLPEAVWHDRSFPLGMLYLWPVPSEAGTLVLYLPTPVSEFGDEGDLDTEIALPPGYREMLTSNLTVRLGPAFGHAVSDETRQIARESMAAVKMANTQRLRLKNVRIPAGARRRWTRSDFLAGR